MGLLCCGHILHKNGGGRAAKLTTALMIAAFRPMRQFFSHKRCLLKSLAHFYSTHRKKAFRFTFSKRWFTKIPEFNDSKQSFFKVPFSIFYWLLSIFIYFENFPWNIPWYKKEDKEFFVLSKCWKFAPTKISNFKNFSRLSATFRDIRTKL